MPLRIMLMQYTYTLLLVLLCQAADLAAYCYCTNLSQQHAIIRLQVPAAVLPDRRTVLRLAAYPEHIAS